MKINQNMKRVSLVLVMFLMMFIMMSSMTNAATWNSSKNVGLVSYWTFNDTVGNVTDIVAGKYNWTQVGTVGTRAGIINNSRGVTSGSNYFGSDWSSFGNERSFTLSFWANLTAFSNWGTIFNGGAQNSQRNGIMLQQYNTDDVALTVSDGSSQSQIIMSGRAQYGKLVHYVLTYNSVSGNATLYQNNTIIGSVIKTHSWINRSTVRIGAETPMGDGKSGPNYYDEMGLWNRSLSASEISDLYNGGAGMTYDAGGTVVNINISYINSTTTVPGTYQNKTWIFAQVNISSLFGINWVRFDLFDSNRVLINSTKNYFNNLTKQNTSYINFTGLSDNKYFFNVTITDNQSSQAATETRDVLIDSTGINLSLVSPSNNNVSYTSDVNFTVNINATSRNSSFVNYTQSFWYSDNLSGLSNGVLVYYQMNDNTTTNVVIDRSSALSHGNVTSVNTTQISEASPFGSSFNFTNNTYITMINSSTLNNVATGTSSVWVYAMNNSKKMYIFSREQSGVSIKWDTYYNASGFYGWDSGATSLQCSTPTLELNRWQNIVQVWNGVNQTIYINGRLNCTLNSDLGIPNSIQDTIIGAVETDRNLSWKGRMNEMVFWNRTLSASEVLRLYTSYGFVTPIANTTLYVYNNNTGVLVNQTPISNPVTGSYQATVTVVVNLVDGFYHWFYNAFDLAGNKATSEQWKLEVDSIGPNVSFVTPPTATSGSVQNKTFLYIQVNTTDSHPFNWTRIDLFNSSRFLINSIRSDRIWMPNLSVGLITYYDFNNVTSNSTRLVEKTNGKHNTTLTNILSSSYVSGVSDTALNFTGTNQWGNMDGGTINKTQTGNYTISIWAYSRTLCRYVYEYDGDNSWTRIGWDGGGTLTAQVYDGGGVKSVTTANAVPLNRWIHIVVLVSQGKNMSLYVNGTFIGNVTIGTSSEIGTNNRALGSGRIPDAFFDGYIDEMGVWNRTLSSNEVSQLFNSGIGITYPSLPVTATYISNITSANFTSLPDGKYYFNATSMSYNGNIGVSETRDVLIDTLAPNISLMLPTNYSRNSSTVMNFTANISAGTPVVTSTSQWSSILNIGLQNYYNMENNNDDVSGKNNLTVQDGQILFDTGLIGNAGNFSASASMFIGNTETNENWNFVSTNMTINYWVRASTAPATKAAHFIKRSGTGYYIFANSDSTTEFSDVSSALLEGTTQNANIWRMWTIVKNTTHTTLYKDGVLNSYNANGGAGGNSAINVSMGDGTPIGEASLIGQFDEMGVWNRTLSVSEITALYNSGAGITYDANPSTITTYPFSNLSNATLYVYNNATGVLYNQTLTTFAAGTYQGTVTTMVTLIDGVYHWFYNLFDLAGNMKQSEQWRLDIDSAGPNISFLTPPSTPSGTIYNRTWIYVSVNVSDEDGINYTRIQLFNSTRNLINTSVFNYSVLDSGLVAYYNFNDGTANDSSGNKNNGIAYNVTINSQYAKFGNGGARFNITTNQRIDITPVLNISTNPSSFTYSLWFYANSINSSGSLTYPLFANTYSSLRGSGLQLTSIGGGDLKANFQIRNETMAGATLNVNVNLNQWYFITGVYNSSNNQMYFYVDGVLNSSREGAKFRNLTTTSRIGGSAISGDTYYFNGSIDEVRIYNRTLTQAEITSLYNRDVLQFNDYPSINFTSLSDGRYYFNATSMSYNGLMGASETRDVLIDTQAPNVSLIFPANYTVSAGTWFYPNVPDVSGNGNNGTALKGVIINSSYAKWGDGGANFDGVDDWINLVNSPSLNFTNNKTANFTLSVWVNLASNASWVSDYPFILEQDGSRNGRNAVNIVLYKGTGGVYCEKYNNGSSGGSVGAVNIYPAKANQWINIVCVSNDTYYGMYINGVRVAGTSGSYKPGLVNANWSLGGAYGGGALNGSLDEVRIFNRTLSTAEIVSLNNSNTIADTTGLVAYYDFEPDTNLINFTANISSGYPNDTANLSNATLYVYNNRTGALVNQTFIDFAAGTFQGTIGIMVELVDGIYHWFYQVFDLAGNMGQSTQWRLDVDGIGPNVSFITPPTVVSGTEKSTADIYIRTNATDDNMVNYTKIQLFNSTRNLINYTQFNYTSSYSNSSSINFTSLSDGIYYFNATSMDKFGLINATETRNVTIDLLAPQINIIYPLNQTYDFNMSELNYTVNDNGYCWYSTNNGRTNSTAVVAGINFINVPSISGSNKWIVYCNDTINHINSSSITFSLNTLWYDDGYPFSNSSFRISEFIGVSGKNFTLGGATYTFMGADSYYLADYATNHTFNDNGIEINNSKNAVIEILNKAKYLNINVIRTWANIAGGNTTANTTDWVVNRSGGHFNMFLNGNTTNFNETTFKGLDYVIYEASKRDIRLQLVLVNNWDTYGGMRWYVEQSPTSNKSLETLNPDAFHDQFYNDSGSMLAFKAYINYTLNRNNTYSGIKYKDDPAIFAWLLANEPRAKSDPQGKNELIRNWTKNMTAYIKSIDSNHLVGLGIEGFGCNYTWAEGTDMIRVHNGTGVDFATFELHPYQWDWFAQGSENATNTYQTGGAYSNSTLNWWTVGTGYSYGWTWGGTYIPQLGRHGYQNWISQNVNWSNQLDMPVLLQEIAVPTNMSKGQKDRFYQQTINSFFKDGGDGLLLWNLNHDDYYYSTTPDGLMDDGFSFYLSDDAFLKNRSQSNVDAYNFSRYNNTGGTSWINILNNDIYNFLVSVGTPDNNVVSNCSLFLNISNGTWSGYRFDQKNSSTIFKNTEYVFTKTFSPSDSAFYWYTKCCANNSCYDSTSTFVQMNSNTPVIALNNPQNNTRNNGSSIVFSYNVTSTLSLSYCQLYVNGALDKTNLTVTTGIPQYFVESFVTAPSYRWYIQCKDIADNIGTSEIRNFSVDASIVNISLLRPVNGSYLNYTTNINFTANISGAAGLANATIYIYNVTNGLTNRTFISFLAGTYNATVGRLITLTDGVYHWFYTAFNVLSTTFTSNNNTVTIDTVSPRINITTPVNNSRFNRTSVDVNYTVSDINLFNCWYTINGTLPQIVSCGTNLTFTNVGIYNMTIVANDSAGNRANATVYFIIDRWYPNATLIVPINGSYTSIISSAYPLVHDAATYSVWTTNNVTDKSGNGNNGTAKNNIVLSSLYAKFGNGGSGFDGYNSYINLSKPTSFNLNNTKSFSLNVWVYPLQMGNGTPGRSSGVLASSFNNGVYFTYGGQIAGGLRNATYSGDIIASPGGVVTLNNWTFMSVSYNATSRNLSIYGNGIIKTSKILTVTNVNINKEWYIGDSSSILGGDGYNFNGSIDEVRIFNRSLSQEEITSLYTSNTIADTTGLVAYYDMENQTYIKPGKYNGTVVGNIIINSSYAKYGNGGVKFYNSTYIATSKPAKVLFNGTEFTVCGWFNASDSSQSTTLFGSGGASATFNIIIGNTLSLQYRNNSATATTKFVNARINATYGTWSFACVNYNKTNITITQNAGNISVFDASKNIIWNGTQNFRIGDDDWNAGSPNCYIDEVRVFNRTLAQSEITQLYNFNTITDTTDLVAYYDFEPDPGYIAFNAELSDTGRSGLANATLYVYNASGLVNRTTTTVGTSTLGAEIYETTVSTAVRLADGIYTWFYDVMDLATNIFRTQNNTFTEDTTNPQISFGPLSELDHAFINTDSADLSVIVSDTNLMNISIVVYKEDGTIDGAYTWTNSVSNTLTTIDSPIVDGDYTYNASVCDQAGNCNSTGVRNITIDTAKPFVSFGIHSTTNNSYFNITDIVMNVTASDVNLMNISSKIYTLAGGEVGSSLWSDSGNNSFWYNKSGLVSGNYTFNTTVCDQAGNCNATETRIAIVDTLKPVITIPYPGEGVTYATNIPTVLNYSFTDVNPSSGLDCMWGDPTANSTKFVCQAPGVVKTIPMGSGIPFIPGTELADGNYKWYVYVTDLAGNTGFTIRSFTVNRSFAPTVVPTAPSGSGGSASAENQITNFSANASAPLDLSNVTLHIYNSTDFTSTPYYENLTTYTPGQQFSVIKYAIFFIRGTYYWWFDILDTFSNNANSSVSTLYVNMAELQIVSPLNNSRNFSDNSLVYIVMNSTQVMDSCKYSINGVANQSIAPLNFWMTPSVGANNVHVYCRNSNGTAETSTDFNWYPNPHLALNIVTPKNGQYYRDAEQKLSVSYDHANWTIPYLNLSLNGAPYQVFTNGQIVKFPSGNNVLRVRATAIAPYNFPYDSYNVQGIEETAISEFTVGDRTTGAFTDMMIYFWSFMFFAVLAIVFAYLKDSEDSWQFFMRTVWYLMELLIAFGIIVESIKFIRTIMGTSG